MFKRPILLPVAATLGLLLAAFVATYHWEHERSDDREMGRLLNLSRDLFDMHVDNEVAGMKGLLATAAHDDLLAAAFRNRDRDRLQALANPLFERLRELHHLTHLYFMEPDGTVFLRAHLPERFGDKPPRETLGRAITSGETVAGFEIGLMNALTLRVVSPWVVQGELLGYVELGQEANWLVTQLKQVTHAEISLLVAESKVPAGAPVQAWPRLGEWRLAAGTLAQLPDAARALVAQGMDSGDELEVGARIMHAGMTAVHDPSGRELGRLLVLADVTERHATVHKVFAIMGVTGAAVGLLLVVLFGRILKRVEQQVVAARAGLEHEVEQRTAELRYEADERRLAEERLSLLYRAVEQSPASVIITDLEGRIEYVNPRFTEVSGYSAGEVLGKKPSLLKSGDKRPEEYASLWRLLRAGEEWQGEFLNRRKDGTLFCESARISPVRAPDGEIRHFIAVKEDITERKQNQERTRKLQEELTHRDRLALLGEMTATLAHEVRQPLATIVNFAGGCIQRIRSGKGDPESLLFALEKITEQGKLAGEVIRRIRGFVSKGRMERQPTDINALVRQSEELLLSEARRVGVAVELDLALALPHLSADPIQLQQVLLNLMLNSVQAMVASAAPHRLTVRTRDQGERVEITVSDNGPGIAAEDLGRLFQPFFTTKADGMGLGLAVCRSIVEAHGGCIEATANPEGGLSIRFSLPLAIEGTQDAA